jgi:uncharacterized protein YdcH (DUF465 family)
MTGMESKRLMALDRGGVSVDSLAKENRRLRVENAHFRGLVFYDEMLRDTIAAREKEINRLSEALKKANGVNINLQAQKNKLEEEIKKLKAPPLLIEEKKDAETP